MDIFVCPECSCRCEGFPPEKCQGCSISAPVKNGIYWFCNDPDMALAEDTPRYIGYENIGEHFEPGLIIGNNHEAGIYPACSRKLVDLMGQDSLILDLGTGLGSAAIPLARAGAKVVAADISQRMLSFLLKRATDVPNDRLVAARMNAYSLKLADSSIDAVVENAMLHLVDRPELVISEILRVMKPNGKLIKYDSCNCEITPHQSELNRICGEAAEDIMKVYWEVVGEKGLYDLWFDNGYQDLLSKHFTFVETISTDYVEDFSHRMKYQMHRLEHKAFSGMSKIDMPTHKDAWEKTVSYARSKYGKDFIEMPNYWKYRAIFHVYQPNVDETHLLV